MTGVASFARQGGLVLGICNGFQVLLEAGLLRGAMLRNAVARSSAPSGCTAASSGPIPPSPRACHVGQVLRLPIAHGEGNYVSTPEDLERRSGRGRLRYCDADGRPSAIESERLARQHRRAIVSPCRKRVRADAPPRAGRGPAARQHRRTVHPRVARRSDCAGIRSRRQVGDCRDHGLRRAASARLRAPASGIRPDSGPAGPRAEPGRARDARRDVERALQLQALAQAAARSCRPAARACCRARARTPARWTSAMAWRWCSRWSRTTTRARSSHSRAPRRAWAASSATSSPWARGPWRSLDSLRFGDLDDARTRYLFDGVVGGDRRTMGTASACPPSAARSRFDPAYAGNPLVNAMCVGVAPDGSARRARARAVRATRCCWSARTPGATASRERPSRPTRIPRRQPSRRGAGRQSVSREAAARGVPGGARDRRRAGHAGSRRGRTDVVGDRDGRARRPGRRSRRRRACRAARPGSPPSRSCCRSRRSACCCWSRRARGRDSARTSRAGICTREVIGQVTDEAMIRVRDGGQVVAELPDRAAHRRGARVRPAGDARSGAPDGTLWTAAPRSSRLPMGAPSSVRGCCSSLASPNSAQPALCVPPVRLDRPGQYRRSARAAAQPSCASTARARGSAITTDCNPRYMRRRSAPRRRCRPSPRRRATWPASAPSRIAVTDCLNFGNPEKPTVAWQLSEAVAGLAEACRALDVPIVSGNVSLYNETAGRAIPPTPPVGMVGLLEDVERAVRGRLPTRRTVVLLLGALPTSLGDRRIC